MFKDLWETSQATSLVAIGAVFGAWLRISWTNYFHYKVSSKYFDLGTLLVNIMSTFLLGLVLAVLPKWNDSREEFQLTLLVIVGFLGSLSTFSTFVVDVMNNLLEQRWQRGIGLALGKISGGLCAVAAGYKFGYG